VLIDVFANWWSYSLILSETVVRVLGRSSFEPFALLKTWHLRLFVAVVARFLLLIVALLNWWFSFWDYACLVNPASIIIFFPLLQPICVTRNVFRRSVRSTVLRVGWQSLNLVRFSKSLILKFLLMYVLFLNCSFPVHRPAAFDLGVKVVFWLRWH
jgi:hypothetical protein